MDRSEFIYNVERASQHDREAIEALYYYTYPRMHALVCRLCSDQNDVEDILQESYTSAFMKLDSLEEKAAFYNWLKKIVINQWRNYSREKSYLDSSTLYDATQDITDSQLTVPSAYDIVVQTETTNELDRLVNQLPENQRVCVVLYYYEQMKIEDIAEALDIPVGSVKSRLHYGRDRLKKQLEQRGLNAGALLPASAAQGSTVANPALLARVLAALETASQSGTAAVVTKEVGGGVMLRLGIGLIGLFTAGGIIGSIALPPKKPQPTPSATAVSAETTAAAQTSTTVTQTSTTVSTTATTTAATTEISPSVGKATTVATLPPTSMTFSYRAENGGITIIGYSGNEGHIVIPDEIDGLPVKAIAPYAFAYSDVPSSISIPGSVTRIGVGAFRECRRLHTVTFHTGLRSIGETAFLGCSALRRVEIPAGMESIGAYAFAYCGSLQEVTIGEGLTVIRYGTFYQCPSLTSVSLPSSVQDIGENAFTITY